MVIVAAHGQEHKFETATKYMIDDQNMLHVMNDEGDIIATFNGFDYAVNFEFINK